MKYLSDYCREEQSKIFAEHGAFFAFSKKQLDEEAKPGVTYVSLGLGMICPKDKADALIDALKKCHDDARKADLAENGRREVIRRELNNYECSVTWDPREAVAALAGYGIGEEEVLAVFEGRG